MGKLKQFTVFDCILVFICLFAVVITLYPFLYVCSVSISEPMAVIQGQVTYYPIGFDGSAYRSVFQNPYTIRSLFNSVLYTVVGTFCSCLFKSIIDVESIGFSEIFSNFFPVLTLLYKSYSLFCCSIREFNILELL